MEWFVASSEELESVEYQEVGPFHVQKRRSNEEDVCRSWNDSAAASGTAPRATAPKPAVKEIGQKTVRYPRTA